MNPQPLLRLSVCCVLVCWPFALAARALELHPPKSGMALVAQDDLGDPKAQPHLVMGSAWTITDDEKKNITVPDERYLRFVHHDNAVVLRFVGLRPEAKYILRVHYFNVTQPRSVRLTADSADPSASELHGPLELPLGKAVVREIKLPPETYRSAVLRLVCAKTAGAGAMMSAIELWSDTKDLHAPVGCFVRFRVDALPEGKGPMHVTGLMKIHSSPWTTPAFPLTPREGVSATGFTPWIDLKPLPGNANGSLVLAVPNGAKGATQFSLVRADNAVLRELAWDEPDGTRIIVEPGFGDIRTFREQERRYYLNALARNGERVLPLTRPPLMFSNAWGHATGPAAEYMVKTFRVLGFNSVATLTDAAMYEKLYGWNSQGGQYGPPGFMPYDEEKSRESFNDHYRKFFDKGGKGEATSADMRIFQLADEPGEAAVKDSPEARAGFHQWLKTQNVEPATAGRKSWDEVAFFTGKPTLPEDKRLHYWTRRYQAYLTPRMFALAADAVREQSPGKQVISYVALSGHAMNFPSKQPLDMFQLAQYPNLMPGISDWMTGGSWWWDSHQSVAYSVAPFNAGSRRHGKDADQPPISFPMMHCVNPSPLRAYTQLANNCKLISYYNYGPDYEATEGFWSNVEWEASVVGTINNRAAQVDDILGPGVMRRSRVAMLYADPQETWWPQGSFADKRASFLALSHDYYQPELVTERQVREGALTDYDALYVLDQYVSRGVQERIGGWVNAGGLLWACADAAIGDEYTEPCDMLDKLAGVKRDFRAALAEETQVAPTEGESTFAPHPVPPLGRSKETIRPGVFTWDGAAVRAKYADGQPAWAQKKIGKGTVVYVAHRCGLAISRRTGKRGPFAWWPDAGRQLLSAPLFEARVDREISLSSPFMVASPLSTPAGTVAILYDLNATPAADVVMTLREPAPPKSVRTFNDAGNLVDLPFEFADGRLRVKLGQVKWDGQIVVVRRGDDPKDDRPAKMRESAEAALASGDWQSLSAGAWFAGFFPDWNLGDRLVPLLRHEHWAVRRSAAESLGRLKWKDAGRDLRAALDKETDSHALADELLALVRIGHRDVKSLCEKYRAHADPFLRGEADRANALREAASRK